MDREIRHLVGLLLGTEDDWPRAFTALLTGQSPQSKRHHVYGHHRPDASNEEAGDKL